MLAEMPHLERAAGPLLPLLRDPAIREIRCNSNHKVFAMHAEAGKQQHPDLEPRILQGFLALIADLVGGEFHHEACTLHAADPALGIRIEASMPPVSPGVEMTLRKHPSSVYPLPNWIAKGILTPPQVRLLMGALDARKTVFFSGPVGSAKTSLLNACLHYLSTGTAHGERYVIVEDDPEAICEAADVVWQRTTRNVAGRVVVDMATLCDNLLRKSPDRIVIGELRGAEALPALQAMQTGHPGLCTVHAASARSTLLRLEQLVLRVSLTAQRPMIAEAVQLIVHMEPYRQLWRCTAMLEVDGLDATGEDYHTRLWPSP
jgi:type IV secretion system protein TrbB